MSEATDFAAARRVPPAEAIAYMQGRQQVATTFDAHALWQDEHSRAFTVSRLARADLLQALQGSLAKSVDGDLTRRDWIRSTERLLQDAGWWGTKEVIDPRTGEVKKTRFDHARLQLIFDTNVRQAQGAGQWQRMQRNRRTHPYATYLTMNDGRERPLHRQWHGVTLPLDHPWFLTHWAPNGYRCRCRMVAKTRREYEAGTFQDRPDAGIDGDAAVRTSPMVKQAPTVNLIPWENPVTGQLQYVPEGIDPGFDYNPGATGYSDAFDAMVRAKIARLPPPIARAAQADRLRTGLPSETFEGQRPGLFALPDVRVPSISGDAFGPGLSHAELMAAATRELQALQQSDGLVNDDSGWLLAINRRGVKKMGDNAAQSPAELAAVAALRDLVRQAVVAERHADTRHGNAFAEAIFRMFAPLEIGGTLYRVKLTVKSMVNPDNPRKLLHALGATEMESAPLGTLPTSTGDPALQSTQPTTGRTISIADLLRGAVLQDGRPFVPE